MTTSARRPVGVDLFAGAGGMSLGFLQAGVDVRWAVDSNSRALEVHARNLPGVATLCKSVADILPGDVSKALDDQSVDVVFGGPPCQGFSVAGARDPADPRNALILEFARLVTLVRPSYFVLENVRGLLDPRYSELLSRFEAVIGEAGFSITMPIRVLNAADFGVPQRRHRAFLLGTRSGFVRLRYPEPVAQRVNVWDAIGDLHGAAQACALSGSEWFEGSLGVPSAYAAMLRGDVADVADAWRPEGSLATLGLSGFTPTSHSEATVSRFRSVKAGGVDAGSRFIRLKKDGLCTTLRAGTGAERGSFMAPRPIHPESPRCVCLREAARMQSFPDWFQFDATKWHGFMQLGNSVPPRLARAVAAEVVRAVQRSDEAAAAEDPSPVFGQAAIGTTTPSRAGSSLGSA